MGSVDEHGPRYVATDGYRVWVFPEGTRVEATASTLTVAEFVEARMDEDEAVARAATAGTWVEGLTREGSPGRWRGIKCQTVLADRTRTGIVDHETVADSQSVADVIHIVRHDPARVLAQCAAMRQIVERASWVLANPTKVSHDEFSRAREDLYDLAEIWKDHPDHVWGGVIRITQEAYDEAMAILDAEDKRP